MEVPVLVQVGVQVPVQVPVLVPVPMSVPVQVQMEVLLQVRIQVPVQIAVPLPTARANASTDGKHCSAKLLQGAQHSKVHHRTEIIVSNYLFIKNWINNHKL